MALFYYYNIYIEILNLFLPQASLFLDQKYQCAAYSCIWVLHAKANKLHKYLLTVIVIFLAFWPFCFLAFCLFRLNKGHKRHALTCLMRLPLVLFFEGKDTKVDSKAMHLSKIFGLLTCLVFRTFWTWTVKNFSKFIRTFNRKSTSKLKPKLPKLSTDVENMSKVLKKLENLKKFWNFRHKIV